MISKSELKKLSCHLQANPDNYMESFRENIRMYIDQKGVTLAEVSELADMPESTLKSFVYGKANDCHLSTAIKLARVFMVSIDELVGCGTISPQTCESLQIIRQLPLSFTHFVRHALHLHYRKLTEGAISEKAIEVTEAKVHETGGICLTTEFTIMDISDLKEDLRAKVFMGIRIPSDLLEPHYFEGDTLLIANDRNPRDGEHVVASVGSCIYILKTKVEKIDGENKRTYYSIRDGKLRSTEDRVKLVIGYIAHVLPGDENED